MTKLCKELVGHILQKWPQAELYLHSGSTMHENEITVTYANDWFITLSHISGKVSAMIYMVSRSVNTGSIGYRYLKEYQIGNISKKGRYPVCCMQHDTDNRIWSVYWSLPNLVAEIEKQIDQLISSDGKLARQEY